MIVALGDEEVRLGEGGIVAAALPRPRALELESRLLSARPFGHKHFVRVLAADESVLASGVLSAYAPSLRVELD